MSMIPNARPLFSGGPYMKSDKGVPFNAYWQGLLDENGTNILTGFDNAVDAANNLFDNLDVYENAIDAVFGEGSCEKIDTKKLNGIVPFTRDLKSEHADDVDPNYFDFHEYTEKELENVSVATKVFLLMKYILNDYFEMKRDEINASLIEWMDKNVYEKNLKEAKEKYGETGRE